jgi:hypothetical protein
MKVPMVALTVAVLLLVSAIIIGQVSTDDVEASGQTTAAQWSSEKTDMMLAGDGGGDGGGVGAGGDL